MRIVPIPTDHSVELRDIFDGRAPEPAGGPHASSNLTARCVGCHRRKTWREKAKRSRESPILVASVRAEEL